MENLDEKFELYKKIIKNWRVATENIFELGTVTTVPELEGQCDKVREQLDTIMLTKIKALFNVPLNDTTIYDDEWFWAEWDTSINCFYYIYGKTCNVRRGYEVAMRRNEEQVDWGEGDYLLVWRGGYTSQAKVVLRSMMETYFTEENGFGESDIAEIKALESGEYYNEETGLYIFKA